MEDIAPSLLQKIQNDFHKRYEKDSEVKALLDKLKSKTAKHTEAYTYAGKVGSILSDAYANNLSSAVLPEGKMWYNIGKRVIAPTLEENYKYISDYVSEVQAELNQAAGIGIKPIVPPENKDRAKGIIDRLSSEDDFDKVAWILKEPVKTIARSIVDDSIKANVEFHGKAGMQPKIIRKSSGKCCKWCNEVAGVYRYPDVPDDIYRRHKNCDCVVEYNPGNGKRQNVHTKQWRTQEESDKIERRKRVSLDTDKNARKTEYRRYVGDNGLTYDESRALTDYVSSESYIINDKLRRGAEVTHDEKQFCTNLDSALKKLPTYSGNLSRSLYFYSQDDIRAFVGSLQEQKIITFAEYLSTTKGTELYNPEGQVQMYIQNSTKGHDLGVFNQNELEVLYERKTKFKVQDVKEFEGIWYVLLEEG